MEDDLAKLIQKFNEAQLQAVEVLETVFDCPRPETNMDFVIRCAPLIREKGRNLGGSTIRPHGYGIEITFGSANIDFDFGQNGEINGFDPWRLHYFVKSNSLVTPLDTEEKIKKAVEQAMRQGKIYKSNGLNYYLNS